MKEIIPFDIKYRPQIESGEYKVCCQDLHTGEITYGRIVCWDAKGGIPILFLADYGDSEFAMPFRNNGEYVGFYMYEHSLLIDTGRDLELSEAMRIALEEYPLSENEKNYKGLSPEDIKNRENRAIYQRGIEKAIEVFKLKK